MSNEDLKKGIQHIRKALDVLEAKAGQADRPSEGVRDLGLAVDDLRRGVWATLTSRHSGNYQDFLARIRVRRATESCEEILADLHAETVTANTPGLPVLHATLKELVKLAGGKK
ncbi:MAG: hypothetical protein JSW51_12380 [Gemmatimonadota bacterium]|nr:MAG: hypothetical protein JSW51_12380 [Gemmatimonadota bacterium]